MAQNKELEAVETLYNEREYLLGEKVNNKSKTWSEDIKHYDTIGTCLIEIKNALTRLEKYQKAIEIVKRKNVGIDKEITDIDNYEEYKKVFWYICEELALTEEEFNLLKEVFGNE